MTVLDSATPPKPSCLGTELMLTMLAEGVPLLFFPDLAGFTTRRRRTDFTPEDLSC